MQSNKRFYIGIDGGGTKTLGLLCNQNGVILAKSTAGSTNLKSRAEQEVRSAIHHVIMELTSGLKDGKLAGIFVSTAGGDREEDQKRWERWLRERLPSFEGILKVKNDAYGALASGTFSMEGTVLIAGTGSISYSIDANGSRRVGGWGYLFGDEGSGYDIGRKALRKVAMMHDGRMMLDEAFCSNILSFLQVNGAPEMITAIYEDSYARMKVASVAEKVIKLAERQNQTALKIVQRAFESLSELVRAIEIRGSQLVICGGLMQSSFFRNGFLEEMKTRGVSDVYYPNLSPAVGACICALLCCGVPLTEERKANLMSSHHVMDG
ncbi:BadF/BadG/BcrA/BcrD ATPase family protein [Anaerobacillus sp. 1_MG-2023]|uniref:N-acetylglucosamine kinase n=1 Tax=Anaerobacillus sp. 1_MG-2023 TaxID=3062655 RepID=UPI0026E46BD0|nr:BadF/BadG/BcrA/BcrD ATPase family protein [Anaerobacillus sp. 1_MG-2023]MDO6657317.1 BadF/BadG/BcrA/BcrD ATPase family protein [Anaerobacillus sp. 1_MG-2023]